ncbi:cytochrome oxidase biogenesis protein Surf1 facilitates heme A insertion [Photobacterium jeanii]|uniref:SURF1-like protein n=1 Tax=Photobacterium jeanii TaxID=858640 RepID=A0A178KI66_9GAMM|nr:SURF1 family protein [Photobacterium jeanii]OAN16967.1 cytochrome oxidase biogenesis protein Surf1 facilitates heme A insertion [Photobacterium jeanii]PST88257.1 SURF1 family protein [Photobacterium jeanii]
MRRIGFILFTVAVMLTLVKLGLWQLSRAHEKEALNTALKHRSEQMYYSLASLPPDPRWYGLTLYGKFDHGYAVLLDNQIYHGQVGYHLLYPFKVDNQWVLVNLGWLAAPQYRDQLPILPEHHGELRVEGIIAPPSKMPTLAASNHNGQWPQRVQVVDIEQLAVQMDLPLQPWVLQIDPENPMALQQNWTPVVMGPHKHYAYAVQWFLMAVAISGLALWWLKRTRA